MSGADSKPRPGKEGQQSKDGTAKEAETEAPERSDSDDDNGDDDDDAGGFFDDGPQVIWTWA